MAQEPDARFSLQIVEDRAIRPADPSGHHQGCLDAPRLELPVGGEQARVVLARLDGAHGEQEARRQPLGQRAGLDVFEAGPDRHQVHALGQPWKGIVLQQIFPGHF